VVLAAFAGASLLAAPRPQQREVRQRQIYVSVFGRDDKPVRDLKATDFIVREDDIAREVLQVAPAPPASHIALLVDDSAASVGAMPRLRPALLDFVRYILAQSPPPQIALTTFGERPTRRVPFTTSDAALMDGIGKLFAVTNAGSYFLEAVLETTADFRKRSAERPMMLAFVEDQSPEFSNTTRNQVVTALQTAHATLWSLILQRGNPDITSREYQERTAVLNDVAVSSGGAAKVVLSDLGIEQGYTWAASLLTSQYRLTYSRPESLVPPTRLSVEVRQPNLRVAATRWAGR
jgi:hypothetical protein